MAVYSNTIISLLSAANDINYPFSSVASNLLPYGDVTVENNIVHAPTMDTPITSSAPMDIVTAMPGVTATYKGVWFKGDSSIDTSYASPSFVPLPVPQSRSAAYQSATMGRVAYHDFFGQVRGASPSRGAVEPG